MSFNAHYPLTEDRIAKRYKEGRGSGHLESYKPWITEADLPPKKGHKDRGVCSVSNRRSIALSAVESFVRNYYEWAPGVTDIREQFPLDREVTRSIAREMGIQHPRDRFSKIDVVMTTDLVIDYSPPDGLPQLLPRSVKAISSFGNFNDAEHGEIERRYWLAMGHRWSQVTDSPPFMTTHLKQNLARMRPWRFRPEMEQHPGYFDSLCRLLITRISNYSGTERLAGFALGIQEENSLPPGEVINTIYHLLYTKKLTADIVHTPILETFIYNIKIRNAPDDSNHRLGLA